MIKVSVSQVAGWNALPLCSRYLGLFFNDLPVLLGRDGSLRLRSVKWALGALSDGDCEFLGAWVAPDADGTPWQLVAEDLEARGVDQARFIFAADPSGICTSRFGATVLPSFKVMIQGAAASIALDATAMRYVDTLRSASTFSQARSAFDRVSISDFGKTRPELLADWRETLERRAPLYALTLRLRRVVLTAERRCQQVSTAMASAASRHGPLADRGSAISFVVQAFERSQHRLIAALSSVKDAQAATSFRADSAGR